MDDIVKKLLNGTLSLPLHNCKLTQRGAQEPIIYTGYGLIDQNRNLEIQLRLFAVAVERPEALMRQFDRPLTPGILVPDSGYYDFEGTDLHGEKWSAKRLTIKTDFGASTYIQIEPRQLTKADERNQAPASPFINAFIPLQIELPWHDITQFGELSWKRDKFSHNTTSHEWSVRKTELGTWIHFSGRADTINDDFENFIRALSILCGRHLSRTVTDEHIGLKRATHVRSIEKEDVSLLPPLNHQLCEQVDAHGFITKFLAHPQHEHLALIHRMWHRVLRARESDIENSSLVLAVAIEGLLMEAISNKGDTDAEFQAEIDSVKPQIKSMNLPKRIQDCIQSSFGNAIKPKPQSILQILIKQRIIDDAHLKVWKKMRNHGAHGNGLDWEPEAIQKHLVRFHTCLDLFYRLTFFLIGYTGKHRNYSAAGWPTTPFPNPSSLTQATTSPISTSLTPAANCLPASRES